jgi:hypothetical protein
MRISNTSTPPRVCSQCQTKERTRTTPNSSSPWTQLLGWTTPTWFLGNSSKAWRCFRRLKDVGRSREHRKTRCRSRTAGLFNILSVEDIENWLERMFEEKIYRNYLYAPIKVSMIKISFVWI